MFDIHCHILPGVDDGARTMVDSLNMLEAAQRCGIDSIVCTPHCRGQHFDPAAIRAAFDDLSRYAQMRGIQMTLGYEVHWQKLAELGMQYAPSLVIGGTNLFLLEFSTDALPANWRGIVQALQNQGLQVIVAHPERYAPVQKHLDLAREMRAMGCLLQLSGNFASSRGAGKQTALHLLQEGLVDYVASDAHCPGDYQDFVEALRLAR